MFSEGFEEEIFDLKERIKLLEEALREIKEITNIRIFPDDWDWSSELIEIGHKIDKIPNL